MARQANLLQGKDTGTTRGSAPIGIEPVPLYVLLQISHIRDHGAYSMNPEKVANDKVPKRPVLYTYRALPIYVQARKGISPRKPKMYKHPYNAAACGCMATVSWPKRA